MDRLDKNILFILLKDGDTSQSELARVLGESPQVINFRLKKMIEAGIIKDFRSQINPYLLGGVNMFVAYEGVKTIDVDNIGAIFKCLEKTDFYEIQAGSDEELQKVMSIMDKEFGKKIMQYRPNLNFKKRNLNYKDIFILNELLKDPFTPPYSISEKLGIKTASVKNRINRMRSERLINTVPIIDLSLSNIYLYTIISNKKLDDSIKIDNTIIKINDIGTSIYVGIEVSLSNVKSNLQKIRKLDPEAELMMVYDYDFRSDFARKTLNKFIENYSSNNLENL